MDINAEIQKASDKFITEKLPAMVEEKVGKMVDGILDDIFRSYSDTAKAIKAKIEQKLNINLQEFDMLDYNAMISRGINDRLIKLVNEGSLQPIMSLIQDTVGFIEKKEINLSEIHQMLIDASMEGDDQEFEGGITFIVKRNDQHKWYDVYADLEADKEMLDCGISFTIHDNGRIYSFRSGAWRANLSKITPSKLTQLDIWEHKMFRLYSAAVKITVDETDFDNSWNRHD